MKLQKRTLLFLAGKPYAMAYIGLALFALFTSVGIILHKMSLLGDLTEGISIIELTYMTAFFVLAALYALLIKHIMKSATHYLSSEFDRLLADFKERMRNTDHAAGGFSDP